MLICLGSYIICVGCYIYVGNHIIFVGVSSYIIYVLIYNDPCVVTLCVYSYMICV